MVVLAVCFNLRSWFVFDSEKLLLVVLQDFQALQALEAFRNHLVHLSSEIRTLASLCKYNLANRIHLKRLLHLSSILILQLQVQLDRFAVLLSLRLYVCKDISSVPTAHLHLHRVADRNAVLNHCSVLGSHRLSVDYQISWLVEDFAS